MSHNKENRKCEQNWTLHGSATPPCTCPVAEEKPNNKHSIMLEEVQMRYGGDSPVEEKHEDGCKLELCTRHGVHTPCSCPPVAKEKQEGWKCGVCKQEVAEGDMVFGKHVCPTAPSDWEERLQFEVMEDYVIDIQDGFAIQQRGTDTEYAESCKKMQGHFEKLKAFIRKVEADARTNEREAAIAIVNEETPSHITREYRDTDAMRDRITKRLRTIITSLKGKV